MPQLQKPLGNLLCVRLDGDQEVARKSERHQEEGGFHSVLLRKIFRQVGRQVDFEA